MKFDITDQERNVSVLSHMLTTYVLNVVQEYEQTKEILVEEVKKLREENSKLKKEIENKECSENCKC